jgi:hypothetical protein
MKLERSERKCNRLKAKPKIARKEGLELTSHKFDRHLGDLRDRMRLSLLGQLKVEVVLVPQDFIMRELVA